MFLEEGGNILFIHEMLNKAAEDYPYKEGFICKDKRIRFSEVVEASNKVANFLIAKGVKHGHRIGIFSAKSIEEIIVIFAVMKIGGIFVDINPHFKEQQLAHIVSDCDIKILFIHESKERVFLDVFKCMESFDLIISMSPKTLLKCNNLYQMKAILQEYPSFFESCYKIHEEDIASIIYTSGSTGKPKGITVTHKIFIDATVTSVEVLQNTCNDHIISVTPFSFDGALSQLFTSVFVGATLVLQASGFPKDIVMTMLTEKITGFHAVPSFWRMLLKKYSPFSKYQYPYLRYVSIIGEVFQQDELAELKSVLKDTKFYMMYGITEAFRSTYLHPDDFEIKKSSIGKPLPGVSISIVGNDGKECACEEVGEIVHRGAFISPGYWNDPERTAQVFKDNALYTGDLGKKDKEGYIYFMGRKDSMIKAMGYRISPDEIEECINKMPGVQETAVIGIRESGQDSRIKAFIVCKSGCIVLPKDIIAYCKANLPYYMVPSSFEFRHEIPKTATYKINRSELA